MSERRLDASYMEAVGRRVRQARVESGVSVAREFAEKIGCRVETLYRYEAGTIMPSAPALEQIARATNRPMEWFLDVHDDERVLRDTHTQDGTPVQPTGQTTTSSEIPDAAA